MTTEAPTAPGGAATDTPASTAADTPPATTTEATPAPVSPGGLLAPPTADTPPAPPEGSAPASQTPSTPTGDFFRPDGTLAEGWVGQLPEEFAGAATQLERFGTVTDLARSYVHLRANQPKFPGEDASKEDIAAWRESAGVPETPEGYALTKPDDLPDGVEWSDERAGTFAELAHKHHVHPAFLQEAMRLDAEQQAARVAQAQQAQEQQLQAGKEALMKDWGNEFQTNINNARHLTGRFAESLGLTQEQVTGLSNDPAFVKMMHHMHGLISEDSTRMPMGIGDVRTPGQRAKDIMTGKDSEWGEKYQNGDLDAMNLVANLLKESSK